jgi:transposase InsO family protein
MARKRVMMQLMDAIVAAGAQIPNVSQWCRVNGVDRRTFYRHRARAQVEGQWRPRSRRPKTSPHATPEPVVAQIVRLRQVLAPDNGADFIRDALTELATTEVGGDWAAHGWRVPSRATINRILARHNLLESNPRKRPRSSWRRFSYARPRDCYQIDATEITLADGATAVVVEVLDDATRLLVATHAAGSETADAVITAIHTAAERFGAPGIVLSDNGAAYTARLRNNNAGPTRFARTVAQMGARLIHSSPYHPQTCGKVERHHHTFKRWLATTQPAQPTTLTDLQTAANTYQHYYNTRRPHSAIDRKTPWQAWETAPSHGGPQHLPVQTDATIHTPTVSNKGEVRFGHNLRGRVPTTHANQQITIIRDHDRATAYTTDGNPIGYLHLDHTKGYQGVFTPTT